MRQFLETFFDLARASDANPHALVIGRSKKLARLVINTFVLVRNAIPQVVYTKRNTGGKRRSLHRIDDHNSYLRYVSYFVLRLAIIETCPGHAKHCTPQIAESVC